ncbi:ThiF family adenylyltransferase [Streptomyces niveus]|uniref:ThiF family adenylyltransferase n=1 Tax=Streptomyces niveus TaxID=193462 RepID=UPI0036D3B118
MESEVFPADVETVAVGTEAVDRNLEIISEREQAALRAATLLVAGCGGAGAIVEPLARLGVQRFRLADPDRFDVANLNRQVCVMGDVGRPKPEVVADKARAISPSVEVTEYPQGLTLENLDEALDGVHLAFDGIDPQMSAWVKYQLHERAARRGIPVISGMDFGGKPVLYVFDYRRRPVPFYGRATAEAHRENRVWDSMRWVGRTHFPSDFLPVMADRFSNGGTFPQISYCVTGLAALSSRIVLDLLMNRRTRHVVTVDLHAAAMPLPAMLVHRARMPLELRRTLRAIDRATRSGPRPPVAAPTRQRALPERLATVLAGARLAPSPYNSQPWRFEILDEHAVRLAYDPSRWPAIEADPRGWAEGLGCALGAMRYLAHGTWDAESGVYRCARLRDDVLLRRGALGLRATNRGDLLRTPVDGATAKRIELLCAQHGLALEVVSGASALERLARTELDSDASADGPELWAWLRDRARSDEGRRSFGMPYELVDGSVVARVLTARALPGRAAARGRALLAARQRARALRHCGAVLVLRGPRETVADRVQGGAALMRIWLALTEAGYAAQPLGGEFGRPAVGQDSNGAVLAVLRTGRATTTPAPRVARSPLASSVRWVD